MKIPSPVFTLTNLNSIAASRHIHIGNVFLIVREYKANSQVLPSPRRFVFLQVAWPIVENLRQVWEARCSGMINAVVVIELVKTIGSRVISKSDL